MFTEDKRREIVKKLKNVLFLRIKKVIYFFDINLFGRNILSCLQKNTLIC